MGGYKAGSGATIESNFAARLDTLANLLAGVMKKQAVQMEVLTGVAASAATGKSLLKAQAGGLLAAMNKKLVRAIIVGETKAKRNADRARIKVAASKAVQLLHIFEDVEATADAEFAKVQASRQKIADNYLSLKAYAATAINKINNINGLANEYTGVVAAVRSRWAMGLGKYLLMKVEESMLGKGVLQVDKLADKTGNFVFVNGHAVGLSNKLNDFESLSVKMADYEKSLAKLTAAMSAKPKPSPIKKQVFVPAPEWSGD